MVALVQVAGIKILQQIFNWHALKHPIQNRCTAGSLRPSGTQQLHYELAAIDDFQFHFGRTFLAFILPELKLPKRRLRNKFLGMCSGLGIRHAPFPGTPAASVNCEPVSPIACAKR
jgi:hypothetical protein